MTHFDHDEVPEMGIYLYCLARQECLPILRDWVEQDFRGVDDRFQVGWLVESEVVAVIGEVCIAEFSEENLQTLSWLGVRAGRHEVLVEKVMALSPVLPVKFGTLYRSQASLKEFLERHHKVISQGLDHLHDKTEWSVKGYLVEADARRIISAEDTEIQDRRATLSMSPGVRYLQQKQLDTKIDAMLEARLIQIKHNLYHCLASHAIDSTVLRLHSSAVTGCKDRMVFNGGFLLTSETIDGFRSALLEQQNTYKHIGLTLELRGPWPAYNFCPNIMGAEV